MKVGIAWVGDLQYELIEPVSGMIGHYSHALAANSVSTFHHIAKRCADRDAYAARLRQLALPIACSSEAEDLCFAYVDARPQIGHMIEYIWMSPDRWNQTLARR